MISMKSARERAIEETRNIRVQLVEAGEFPAKSREFSVCVSEASRRFRVLGLELEELRTMI